MFIKYLIVSLLLRGGGLGPEPLSGAEELDGLGGGGGHGGADGVLGLPAQVLRQPPQVRLVPPQSVHRLPAAPTLCCFLLVLDLLDVT